MHNILFKANKVAEIENLGVIQDNHGRLRAKISITCHDGSKRTRSFAPNNVHQLWCKANRLVTLREKHARTNAYLSHSELCHTQAGIEHAKKVATVMAKATKALTPNPLLRLVR